VTQAPGVGRHRIAVPPQAEPLSLVSQDGIALAAMHLPHPSSSTAIVVAHGFGGAHDQERVERIAQLLNEETSVVAVTQRGHGDSGGMTTLGHREPMDVEAAVAWARGAGYDRVVTVGFSMGAAVVLRHAALLGPESSDAVIAVSGPAYWFYRGTTPMRWLHRGISTPAGRAYIRTALGTRVDPEPWPDPPPMPPTEAAARVREHGIDLLIVHGDADGFFPLDHPRALHEAAPGSELWIEPGFGHAEGAIEEDLVRRIGTWAMPGAGRGATPGLSG
jgi:pimeloyl-ACP methyl ester carboxylesterase